MKKKFAFWFNLIFTLVMYAIIVTKTGIKYEFSTGFLIMLPLFFLFVVFGFKTGFFKRRYENFKKNRDNLTKELHEFKEKKRKENKEAEERARNLEIQKKIDEEKMMKKESKMPNPPKVIQEEIPDVFIIQEEYKDGSKVPLKIEIDNPVQLGFKIAFGFWLFTIFIVLVLWIIFGISILGISNILS